MKKYILTVFCCLEMLFLLLYPHDALHAAKNGLELWLNVLMPTLLPFLILTGILLHTDLIEKICRPIAKIWKIGFGISPSGAYALLAGILCGYPVGAKITSDLYEAHKIRKREAEYLLTFTNHASPVFVRTYLCHICLDDKFSYWETMAILLFSSVITMLFFRFVIYRNNTVEFPLQENLKKKTSVTSSTGAFLDVSIMNGFETITRLGGYILMFSILSACISCFWTSKNIPEYLVTGLLELTTGLYGLHDAVIPPAVRYILSISMTAFGGICIIFQTRGVITEKLSILPYIAAKILNGTAAGMLVLFFTQIV